MKKDYVKIKDNAVIGKVTDVILDPEHVKEQEAEGIEYVEVPEALKGKEDLLELVEGQLKVNKGREAKKVKQSKVPSDKDILMALLMQDEVLLSDYRTKVIEAAE